MVFHSFLPRHASRICVFVEFLPPELSLTPPSQRGVAWNIRISRLNDALELDATRGKLGRMDSPGIQIVCMVQPCLRLILLLLLQTTTCIRPFANTLRAGWKITPL